MENDMKNNGPVLAMYSIRSKQEYIFKTNRILEVVGASTHIRDAWKYLFECAKSAEMAVQRVEEGIFKQEEIFLKFEKNCLQIVELFCGGGNETLLLDSYDSFVKLNRVFSFYLLNKCPGMIPMAVCVNATDNYNEDYKRLMSEAEIEKNKMAPGQDSFIFPFTMMDRNTFKPMTRLDSIEGKRVRYSEESYTKRIKGIEERNIDQVVKMLDDMVTNKGQENLLAVVHADGNNMGSKIMEMLGSNTSYDYCVNKMRFFTGDTAKAFGQIGLDALEKKKEELSQKVNKESALAYRVIIKDGDDMTFICNARYVMEYVIAYIEAVQEYKSEWQYSSCAGICIFHSHYPFAKAYQLAEQACDEGAKNMVHKVDEQGKPIAIEEGWVDFHYIHSGIGGSLKEIRNNHNTVDCMARPWIISGDNESVYNIESLYKLSKMTKESNISRSYIKNIGACTEESIEVGFRELQRVYDHFPKFKEDVRTLFSNEEEQLKAFYDLSEMYDLWFTEG